MMSRVWLITGEIRVFLPSKSLTRDNHPIFVSFTGKLLIAVSP